ncbi:hypothetical protein EVG20_g9010 [Dentipellis fragilis]|uniref:Actin interacting protein 3 C-terminal domain-containing protein n=1 Tax=Dentipellis fragilis TaxID=205917 RepID=A0A4Y9Y376_9AGAM|nr:hypothetical protein EVG20_g9010 [Dentipellis fragilis]
MTWRTAANSRAYVQPPVESAVTRLLVSIKQLLESLTKWSTQKATEEQVSDVYVQLGNDFNAAVAAFAAYNIDMSELMGVPDELRGVLEDCLSEDANPKNLDKYLPKVRAIITGLLQGLRGKQSLFRQIVSGSRHRSDASGHSRSDSSRVSRSTRVSRRDTQSSTAGSEVGTVDGVPPSSAAPSSVGRRSTNSTSSRRREPSYGNAAPNGDDAFVGGFAPSLPVAPNADLISPAPDRSSGPPPQMRRYPSGPPPPEPPRSDTPPTSPPYRAAPVPQSPPVPTVQPPDPDKEATPVPPNRTSQVPSHVKRYSLVDKPLPPPTVVVDEVTPAPEDVPDRAGSMSPPPDTPPLDSLSAPGVASSLAALKKSDALERRASKRFSTYNISKMTGGPRERNGSGSGHPNRRSLAASNALTDGELAVLAEADEEESTPPPPERHATPTRSRSRSRGPAPVSRGPSPIREDEEEEPPVPPLPRIPLPETPKSKIKAKSPASSPARPPVQEVQDGPITAFLQVGREVKKSTIEPGLTLSSLRMLFLDKFAYNPGQDNFPAIYIRDPSSGVQYELEDMDEVKDKCLLSLNIEPLDQIKQHIDVQISGLAQELKDLRQAVTENRRASTILPMTQSLSDGNALPANAPRPTDRQLQTVARRLSRLVRDPSPPSQQAIVAQMTGQSLLQPQMTGASVMSDFSNRVVSDLKTQFDEVQNLRRDLGIMRQLYSEFMKQTKDSLGTLRTQTQKVRQMATGQVPGARAYIDTGKTKLDSRSQNVLTKMEELQDTVEMVKDDVLKRHISPKPSALKAIKEDVVTVATELESLKEHIKTIKPMWKKTWEEELQSIVEEQQFLNHQEEFLADLLEDHKAVIEVFGHVEKVISIRGSNAGRASRKPGFRPPLPEEGHGGLTTVMLEIKGAAVDPDRRMKAIAANQKNREKELAARSDDFEAELKGFVGGKKLKMTGGAEEIERVRQKRNDMTLKAMFTGSSSSGDLAGSDVASSGS